MKTPSSMLPATPSHPLSDPGANAGPGRPSLCNAQMIDALCSIIRETGASDSGAAARMSLHPSTLSRWKKESPSLAIMLRGAREDFRAAQLAVIFATVRSGPAAGWRAAAWLLERVFPEDYAPRAAERAKFQELYDARCASELEGSEIAPPTSSGLSAPSTSSAPPALPAGGEAWQNVKNAVSNPPALPAFTDATALGVNFDRAFGTPLQNVKNSALAGPLCPPVLHPRAAQG